MDVKDQSNNTGMVQEPPTSTTTMDVKFQTFTIKLVFNNTEVGLHVPNRRSHPLQWKVLPVTGHSKYTVDFLHPVTVGRQCSVRVHVDGVHIKALNCSINQAALRPERDPKFGNTRRWMQIGQFETGKLSLGFMLRLDGMVEEGAEGGGGGGGGDNTKAAHCQLSRVAVFVDKQQEGGGGQSSWFTD